MLVWASNSPYNSDPGGATLTNNFQSTTTTVTRTGGGSFDLASIDVADTYNTGVATSVLFVFIDGGTTTQTITLDALIGAETFVFNRAALLSFSYTPQGDYIQVDNVVYDSAVPEPATYGMVLAGLALAGSARRFRCR